MKCEKCGSNWVSWKNLGRIDAYMCCPDCGREQSLKETEEPDEEDGTGIKD